jgi:undecaprenyl-diphosphatase
MNSFEAGIVEAIQRISTPALDWFFRVVTAFGEVWLILAVVAGVLYFAGAKKALKYGTIMAVAFAVGQLLKHTVRRERPSNEFTETILDLTRGGFTDNWAFPSGHTTVATVTAIFLCLMVLGHVKSKWSKASVIAGFSAFVLLVGFSRVYLGVHYISDIIGAILITALVYVTVSYVFEKCYNIVTRRFGCGQDHPCQQDNKKVPTRRKTVKPDL